jgi:peptidoglycan/LPS O-acetylase OafA/YrhL
MIRFSHPCSRKTCACWPWLLGHLLTYAISASLSEIGNLNSRRIVSLLTAAGLCVLAVTVQPAFSCSAAAILLVKALRFVRRDPGPAKLVAKYSCEFYLVHGIVMVGCFQMFEDAPLLSTSASLLCSIPATIALARTAAALNRWLSGLVLLSSRPDLTASPVRDPAAG